ncbi:NUDIX domain-containing protein [Microbacterium sp. cx-55]|uniref:NUDIX domain-containing protein n=1 Tax=Microbacterium sp. cx-55 TaxID=2875948 RepID=UPI001CBFCB75|nr:NUDIX domain-containing protein [Microbacterium sp. cx-55]MBZ4488244.1 NUDIX domain-containing protein [Microbacterium sp. cx-55]UGB34904.1 NUDIX domain-containing protein [Microbacterium sp. cx-55]
MTIRSAGLLLYRGQRALEVLIAHMGGPFWARKNEGAWSIPKGEFDPAEESAADAAAREFREELGVTAPAGPSAFVELGTFAYASGKRVTVFVAQGGDLDLTVLSFGEFEMGWPPRSERTASFPEVDRVAWVTPARARELLVKGQRPAIDALEAARAAGPEG